MLVLGRWLDLERLDADGGAGGGAGANNGAGDPPPETTPVTLTKEQQALVDRLVGDARKKAREQAKAEYEEAQRKAAEEAEAKRQAEQGQYKELADKAEQKVKELEATLAERDARHRAERIQLEIKLQAQALGFNDPADANLADLSGVEITEEGQIKGVKEALEALIKAKPYLAKAGTQQLGTPPTRPNNHANPGGAAEPRRPIVRF